MLKPNYRVNNRALITFFCFVIFLPAALIVSAVPIDAFFAASPPDAAEDLIKEADTLVAASETSIGKATAAVEKIGKLKTELERSKELKKAGDASNKTLDDLRKVADDETEKIVKNSTESAAELSEQDKKYDPLIAKLKALPTTAAIEAAVKKLQEQKKKGSEKSTELTKAKDGLTEPINNVFKSVDTLALDLSAQIKPVSEQDGSVDALLKALPDQLPKLISIHNSQVVLEETWTPLQALLKKIVATPATDPAGNLKKSKASISEAAGKVGGWLGTLARHVDETNKKLINLRMELDKNLQENSVLAIKTLDETEEQERVLNRLSLYAKEIAEKTKTASITVSLESFDSELKDFKLRNNLVREGLAGDYKKFVNDFVPLYYFGDIYNLMHVLNPATREIRDVSALREEAEAARRNLTRADLDLREAERAVSGLQVRKRNLENQLKDAETEFNSSSDLLAQATRRLNRFDKDDPKKRSSQDRVDDLTKKQADDKAEYDALKDENKGLPAQIRAAEEELLKAQKNADRAKSNVIMLVQDESLAFAEARDNEPVFFAPNDVTSKDPIKQVIIYAFGNRKIIYLRGTRDNVNKAKNIIAFFDRPAPQARLALWTLELNGKPTKKGSQAFSDSLEIVDGQLSNTRAQIAVTLSLLRKCINDKVNKVAKEKWDSLNSKPLPQGRTIINGDYVDINRWARSFFYEDEVLVRLGFDYTPPWERRGDQAKILARNTLPDPIGAGTLGESLVILALAKSQYRKEIMNDFAGKVAGEVRSVQVPLRNVRGEGSEDVLLLGPNSFNLTKIALDVENSSPYTPIQREIVNSITLASVPRLFKRLRQFDFEPISVPSSPQQAAQIKTNLKREVQSVVDFLWYAYGISTTDLFGFDIGPERAADVLVEDLFNTAVAKENKLISKVIENLLKIKENQNIFRLANAQIAKTDNMVKQLIDAFDEDVNRSIIQPAVYGLRRNLVEQKIGVGIIDRTSVLATNRLIARVDARGSAQLTVGEEQDALLAAQQLANIFMAAKTGGLLGGLSGLKSTQQQRDTSEVYGINSGSVFKVTPFFDPNGQALRFQFDHTQANMVTEPDGSIQPALPRIERHTVNTEVQLSNLELREISRFESNAKLGIPTTYKGGVPIFRDIPYVNKVPLLGWFTRRAGKAAVIQESLILGQTTMYPTIADIFDLLSGDDYNLESNESNKDLFKESEQDKK
jgi:hypothetical protein